MIWLQLLAAIIYLWILFSLGIFLRPYIEQAIVEFRCRRALRRSGQTHNCVEHLRYHEADSTEPHGERFHDEWHECTVCGERYSEVLTQALPSITTPEAPVFRLKRLYERKEKGWEKK